MFRYLARVVDTFLRRTLPASSSPANAALGGTRSEIDEEEKPEEKPAIKGEETESNECFNNKIVELLSNEDLDGWKLRQHFNNIAGMDLSVAPCIVVAGLKACRRLNDFALAIRWLECVREKCADHNKSLWPSIMNDIRPIMKELGIPTLEDLSFEKPELAIPSVYVYK